MKESMSTVYFDGLKKFDTAVEVYAWQRQVFNEDNTWNNDATENGIIVSPHLTLQVNGKEIPVYAARATFSTHSFAYIDVWEENFSLDVELTLNHKRNAVVVLPESTGVKAEIIGDYCVKAKIEKTGSFTFAFEHYIESAFTLLVRLRKPFVVPEGYAVQELQPGRHTFEETHFTAEKTVYRFLKGVHEIVEIDLPSNSVLYLEDGAMLRAYMHEKHEGGVIKVMEKENVHLDGRGLIDFSALGLNYPTLGFSFFKSNNVSVKNWTIINSNTWTVCFTNCKGVHVQGLLDVSYRIFSDGIMLSDCQDGLIEDCFIRTGDDAGEVKSTSDGSMLTDNILFRNMACWTDKACGYGIVFEDNHDTHNVRFENCSVGFAMPNWSKHLGCYTVNTGYNPKATDFDIYFKNAEVYYTLCSAFSICAYKGDIKDIYMKNLSVKYSFHEHPIFVWLRDKGDAHIGNLYLDNVKVNNIVLTEETAKELIGVEVPEGEFDEKNIKINTL